MLLKIIICIVYYKVIIHVDQANIVSFIKTSVIAELKHFYSR